jgi:hypothetical protein
VALRRCSNAIDSWRHALEALPRTVLVPASATARGRLKTLEQHLINPRRRT